MLSVTFSLMCPHVPVWCRVTSLPSSGFSFTDSCVNLSGSARLTLGWCFDVRVQLVAARV